jgi:magnesium-transporting ATPase (P-type)
MRALFEKDYDVPKRWEISGNSTDDKKKIIREHIPLVYVVGQKNQLFTLSRFLLWLSNGVLHAVIIFFIPLYAAEEGIMNEDGHNFDQWSFSIASFTSIILIVNFKLGINTKLWNRFHFACMFGLSIVLYFVFILIYDVVTYTSSFHTVYALLNSHYYYFCIIANVFLVVCIDGACTVMTKVIAPTQSDTMARFALNVENNEYDENSKKHNKDNLSSEFSECLKQPEFHEQDVKPSKRKPYKVQGKVFDSGDENLEKNEIENRA